MFCSPHRVYYPYHFAPESRAQIGTVLLSPVNPIFGIPGELAGRETVVDSALAAYLGEHGYTITRAERFRELIRVRIRHAGGMYDPHTGAVRSQECSRALRKTAGELCALKSADIVAVPFLVARKTKLVGSYGFWDGVERMVIVDSPYGMAREMNFSGAAVGLSLRLLILDSRGRLLFESYGGIEFATAFVFENHHLVSAKREDHLEDLSLLREGIEIAFHPFIPASHYSRRPVFSDARPDTAYNASAEPYQDPAIDDWFRHRYDAE